MLENIYFFPLSLYVEKRPCDENPILIAPKEEGDDVSRLFAINVFG